MICSWVAPYALGEGAQEHLEVESTESVGLEQHTSVA